MLRFLLYTALALNCSALAATATDRYGGWLLEQPRSSVRTLSFKQSVQLNNKIETLELGFICDRRKGSKSVGVILIPFDGTFQSDQDVIPVLIQRNADQYDPSDLLQNWKNGAEYIFLEAKDDVDELASFMKANEMNGSNSVRFGFANSPREGPQTSNHIAINVSGFSNGFDAFRMACASSQSALARRDCLDILDDIYVDHLHAIYFACHHLTVAFRPIIKFAGRHKSSPNLYFVIPIRSPPMRVQRLNRVIIAFARVWLAIDVNSPYAEAFCRLTHKLYSVSPSHLRPQRSSAAHSMVGQNSNPRAFTKQSILYYRIVMHVSQVGA